MSGKGKQAVRKSGGKPSGKHATSGGKLKEGGKPKELPAASSTAATAASTSTCTAPAPAAVTEVLESKELAVAFPLIKISENARVLPRYTAILTRSEDEGVCMEDLDALQLELEALLSAAALRIRALKGEVGALNPPEDKRDKKAKSTSKPMSPGKRGGSKLIEERPPKKSKDNPSRAADSVPPTYQLKITKVKNLPATAAFPPATSALPDLDLTDSTQTETPLPAANKNDTPNKFWATVEPYCSEITTTDIQVVKELIEAHDTPQSGLTIPPLGKHYSSTWLQEDVEEEVLASSATDKKKRAGAHHQELAEANALVKRADKRTESAAGGGFTQRVVSALLEENLMPSKDSVDDKDMKDGENITPGRIKLSNGLSLSNAANLEIQMRKELQEQGLLDPEDENNKDEGDDEILTELKRCQDELKRLNQHNLQALSHLFNLATDELSRQELRRKLNLVDMQVVDAYKKVMVAKYRKKPLSKKEKEPAWRVLRERDAIVRQLEATGKIANKKSQ